MSRRRQGGSIFMEMCSDSHHTSLFSVPSLEVEHSFLLCEFLTFSVHLFGALITVIVLSLVDALVLELQMPFSGH